MNKNSTLTFPQEGMHFNTLASYYHSTFGVTFKPEFSIGIDGIAGAIGLEVGPLHDVRIAELDQPVRYLPNAVLV